VGGVTGSDYEFDLAVSGDGKTLMAVWSSWAASIPGSTDNLSGDSDILFSRSLDGGVRWSNVRALNTNGTKKTNKKNTPKHAGFLSSLVLLFPGANEPAFKPESLVLLPVKLFFFACCFVSCFCVVTSCKTSFSLPPFFPC
jgi:hypothetical protein